jgi:hypothetical protein
MNFVGRTPTADKTPPNAVPTELNEGARPMNHAVSRLNHALNDLIQGDPQSSRVIAPAKSDVCRANAAVPKCNAPMVPPNRETQPPDLLICWGPFLLAPRAVVSFRCAS